MESPNSRANTHVTNRRKQAWELRIQGKTQLEIAKVLRCTQATISHDLDVMHKFYKNDLKEDAIRHMQIDLERMDKLIGTWWDIANDPVADEYNRAGKFILTILQQRAKILGYCQAQKITITTELPGDVEQQVQEKLGLLSQLYDKPRITQDISTTTSAISG